MGSGRANGSNKKAKSKRSKATGDVQEQGAAPTPPSAKRWEELVSYKSFVGRYSSLESTLQPIDLAVPQ